jgi:hypothetical protein
MGWKIGALIAFLAVVYPPLRALGRWMQRKGRDLEKGRDDGPR